METIFSIYMAIHWSTTYYIAHRGGYTDKLYMLYRRAYKTYQKEVIKNGVSYDFYLILFHEGNKYIKCKGHTTLNEYSKNLCTVNYFLRSHKELVATYFSKNEFSYKEFKKMKTELYTISELVEEKIMDKVNHEKNEEEQIKSTLLTEIIEIDEVDKISEITETIETGKTVGEITENYNPFKHNFEDWHFEILKDCINKADLFTSTISTEETKAIFDCKPLKPLVSKYNPALAYFFYMLEIRNFITHSWQSVSGKHKLFKGPTEAFLKASNLSSANGIAKCLDSPQTKIIDKYLKQLKRD
ncbi:hypothetical protein [Bacteroides thetaiotaomicron]|uniref:hypothetical protein n=1 Tax=Bacteroides thetaiotaomicron TaxID=818 RepID=UPI00321B7385